MDKVCSIDAAVGKVKNGDTIIIGGFLGVGVPLKCVEKLVESGVTDLTLITVAGTQPGGEFDLAPLFTNKRVKRFITSHVGTSPEIVAACKAGEIEQELFPQGTWAEKIRAGAFGLGGVLTPTGLDTVLAQGKEVLTIQGKKYLLELPIKADFAFIKGWKADRMGNVMYDGAVSTNPVVAPAATYTVAEVNEIVDTGEIPPMRVGTPGIFVNAVVQGLPETDEQRLYEAMWETRGRLAAV